MRRFVFQAYSMSQQEEPGYASADLYRMLYGRAECVVGVNDDDPSVYQGFAISHDGQLVWVYVKKAFVELSPTEVSMWKARGMKVIQHADGGGIWMLRHNGVAKELLKALGFTKDKPLPVYHRNSQAKAWADRGWQIEYRG